jgi:molecular chaperone GrpE (heat shock protein)
MMTDDTPSNHDPETTLDSLTAEIRGLRDTFDAKIRYDEVRERLFDSMSDELTQHRQGVFRMQLRPVLLDLVAMHDDISLMIAAPECEPATAAQLELVRESVAQALARNGVEHFTSEFESDEVDRKLHKVVSVTRTADPAVDRRIAARLRVGFRWGERVLRPEWVSVYRHEAADSPQPKTAGQNESRPATPTPTTTAPATADPPPLVTAHSSGSAGEREDQS